MTKKQQILIDALVTILDIAQSHPAFDGVLFESQDYEALAEVGGEVCDWTGIAITAFNALKEAGQ